MGFVNVRISFLIEDLLFFQYDNLLDFIFRFLKMKQMVLPSLLSYGTK
jgi:hypothetical protein